jgi:hypothetical protein
MQQLHLSAGKQAEMLECMEDLSRRDAMPLRDVATAPALEQVCADERLNRVQKTLQVRRLLRLRRFPRLLAAEERTSTALKQLQFPPGIRIIPPPNFEGPVCKAEVVFTSPGELLDRSRQLQRAAGHQALKLLCVETGGQGGCTGDAQND